MPGLYLLFGAVSIKIAFPGVLIEFRFSDKGLILHQPEIGKDRC